MRFKLSLLLIALLMVVGCEGDKKSNQSLTDILTSEIADPPVVFKIFGNAPCLECGDADVALQISMWDVSSPATTINYPPFESPGHFAIEVSAQEGHNVVVEATVVKKNTGLIMYKGTAAIIVPEGDDEEMPVVDVDIELEDPTKDLKPTIHEDGEVPPPSS